MKTLMLILLPFAAVMAQDVQSRLVGHGQYDITKRFFGAVWSINNFKTDTPNNTNIFAGLGYRGKTWWLEFLEQEQWRTVGHSRSFDVRYAKTFSNNIFVYVEPSMFKGGFYEFAFVDFPLPKKFAVGVETENVHHSGPDVIMLGPRIGRPIGKIGGAQFSSAITYRRALGAGKDELRLYLVANIRLHKQE